MVEPQGFLVKAKPFVFVPCFLGLKKLKEFGMYAGCEKFAPCLAFCFFPSSPLPVLRWRRTRLPPRHGTLSVARTGTPPFPMPTMPSRYGEPRPGRPIPNWVDSRPPRMPGNIPTSMRWGPVFCSRVPPFVKRVTQKGRSPLTSCFCEITSTLRFGIPRAGSGNRPNRHARALPS